MTPLFTILYHIVMVIGLIPSIYDPSSFKSLLLLFDKNIMYNSYQYFIMFIGMGVVEKICYRYLGVTTCIPIFFYIFSSTSCHILSSRLPLDTIMDLCGERFQFLTLLFVITMIGWKIVNTLQSTLE
ncbi:hypothetical protein AKO1_006857 [Acrasis kona]|uniref:Uncharacterized protein n=1 Tax=Acrasis kona TaxID=1008807 RepID=A0AAW2YVI8_9EUKA